ncbi:hypothetical protein [Solitalea koreensis]|uniref:Uncharacterized protein n=1 Tax=Solitalea koreensis TaxID=543615 RepID=A0A521BJW3_9SPHI|nr:hypothetical protein [Solitalea koreensis]SMO47444.1 hypothetical protein SAMN06265350_102260 [Solitalea koreensis]
MDQQVQQALEAAVAGYSIGKSGKLENEFTLDGTGKVFYQQLENVFNAEVGFKAKMNAMDEVFDGHPEFANLREVTFDLLLINFFNSDAKKLQEDYLESPEWMKIEDETIDRGTELLNLFLYLQECEDEEIEPELTDYLKEFLLIEEEEFQEELEIYEDVIANQMLMESTYPEIARVAASLNDNAALKDEFYPLMSFFNETDPTLEELQEYIQSANNKPFDTSVLFAILAYNYGIDELPVNIK